MTGHHITIREHAAVLQTIGFSCLMCGECCTEVSQASNIVMVMPDEIDAIMDATGLARDIIVVPYPEFIRGEADTRYTFGWCIRREGNRCMFLKEGKCSIYPHRPSICRTYPFMLDAGEIVTSPCPGTGGHISLTSAEQLAEEMVKRDILEMADVEQVRKVWNGMRVPVGKTVVIDSRGVSILDG